MQENEYKVINITDESETTFIQYYFYCPYYNDNNDLQFPTHLFMSIAPEWVDDLQEYIDGRKIFKIKCSQREWVQKIHGLRYLKMHSLRQKGLIETMEVHW